MPDKAFRRGGTMVLHCAEDGPKLRTDRDAVDLIAQAAEHAATLVMIPVERFDPDFFTLRSGIAGEIVQKFVTYQTQLAIVGDITEHLDRSTALRDFVFETNRGKTVWILPDMDELDQRLARPEA